MPTPPSTDAMLATQQAAYLLAQGELGQITSDELHKQLSALLPTLQPTQAPEQGPGPGTDQPTTPPAPPWSTPYAPTSY